VPVVATTTGTGYLEPNALTGKGPRMPIDEVDERHAPMADQAAIRESITMALYITISLLAVLTAQPPGDVTASAVLTVVWGTTLGLTLAHWLAFQLTARLFAGAELPSHDRMAMVGQAVAAIGVACLVSVPLMLDASSGLALSRSILAGLVGLFAFGAARRHGGSVGRAMIYALVVVAIALSVAIGKYLLTGH
jgi:hypothetical protein